MVKAATLTSALGTFLSAGNVSAAQELASSTASATTSHDGRYGFLAAALLPALGWVGYNIFGPALYQILKRQSKSRLDRRAPASINQIFIRCAGGQQASQQSSGAG